jgi:hypothetical protein
MLGRELIKSRPSKRVSLIFYADEAADTFRSLCRVSITCWCCPKLKEAGSLWLAGAAVADVTIALTILAILYPLNQRSAPSKHLFRVLAFRAVASGFLTGIWASVRLAGSIRLTEVFPRFPLPYTSASWTIV